MCRGDDSICVDNIKFRIRIIIIVNKTSIYHKHLILCSEIRSSRSTITHTHTHTHSKRTWTHTETHTIVGWRESNRHARSTTVGQRCTSATDARRTDRPRRRHRRARKISETGSSAASLPPTTLFSYTPKCTESIVSSLYDDNQCILSDLFLLTQNSLSNKLISKSGTRAATLPIWASYTLYTL